MKHLLILSIISIAFAQCKKDRPGGGSAPVNDARTVLLKDAELQGLPSPYYHFEYDNERYLTVIEHADGNTRYALQYSNKRLSRLTNVSQNRVTKYGYTGPHVTRIDQYNSQGTVVLSILFSYNSKGLVEQIDVIGAADSGQPYKRAVLSYLPDSNLSTLRSYQDRGNGLELNRTYTYTDYDDGINVDDFLLLEDFCDILVVLPQVKFHRNNPRHVTSISRNSEFQTDYQYEYNSAHLPIKRHELTLEVKGQFPGHLYDLINTFSYY